MHQRKWTHIEVHFDDGSGVYLDRSEFDKLEAVEPVLEALLSVRRTQQNINRLLGEAEG